MNSAGEHETTISQVADAEDTLAQLQEHLKAIVESDAFRGSERCGRFLIYIVNQALAGHSEALKERVIGIEVFGRAPDYSTSDDAIVRVTASDVRKRLQQHYRKDGASSKYQIHLPVGSYIPEIICDTQTRTSRRGTHNGRQSDPATSQGAFAQSVSMPQAGSRPDAVTVQSSLLDLPAGSAVAGSPGIPRETALSKSPSNRRLRAVAWSLAVIVLLLATLNLVLFSIVRKDAARASGAALNVLPWSALFRSSHLTRIITSDPEIVSIQQMMGRRISLVDYVNQNYASDDNGLTSKIRQTLLNTPRGDWSAPGDTQIAVNIAELAQSNSRTISVQPASRTRTFDLKTDDNFIFLGSPRSNPWVSLFNDRLDFQFVAVDGSQNEVIRNVHPRQNEQAMYIPTTGTTGESFAIVAFVQNPDQDGQVLLLAGATGQGTDVAGRFVTDLPRLSMALQKCGNPVSGPLKHFEVLLRVNVMAGSSRGFDVVACHVLP